MRIEKKYEEVKLHYCFSMPSKDVFLSGTKLTIFPVRNFNGNIVLSVLIFLQLISKSVAVTAKNNVYTGMDKLINITVRRFSLN